MVFKLCNNRKGILLNICFFVFCLNLGKVAQADNFVVGVEDLQYYPYFDFASDNNSFARALLDQFAKDNDHHITYLPLPIKQFPKWLFEENIDFKFPDNARWQEKNNIHHLKIIYSDEVLELIAGTLVLEKNSNKDIASFKSIGTVTGFYPTLWLDKIAQGKVSIFEDPSPTILVQYLLRGLIDGLDIDLAVANNEFRKLNLDEKIVFSNQIEQEVYSYQLSTVKYPEILIQFNQWQVEKRKFIEALKVEFGIKDVEPQKVDED